MSTPEAICYPRPLQDRIPILVGGSGERRTLRLVAQYADACNLFGDAATVAHKVQVLRQHCDDVGRDPAEITITHLSTALSGSDATTVRGRVDELRPDRVSAEEFARAANAAPFESQIGRYRELADAGVEEAIVSLADVGTEGAVRSFGAVVDAFR